MLLREIKEIAKVSSKKLIQLYMLDLWQSMEVLTTVGQTASSKDF